MEQQRTKCLLLAHSTSTLDHAQRIGVVSPLHRTRGAVLQPAPPLGHDSRRGWMHLRAHRRPKSRWIGLKVVEATRVNTNTQRPYACGHVRALGEVVEILECVLRGDVRNFQSDFRGNDLRRAETGVLNAMNGRWAPPVASSLHIERVLIRPSRSRQPRHPAPQLGRVH